MSERPEAISRSPVPDAEITIARRVSFSAAHLYEQASWSPEKNRAVFGACFTPHGHGHNYTVEAFLTGRVDRRDLMLLNVNDLDEALKRAVAPLDHQHINFTVEEFKRPQSRGSVQLVPTTENLALWIGRRLESTLAGLGRGRLSRLRLFEADDLWVDLPWPTQEAAAPRRDSPIEMSSGRPERIQVTEEVFIRSMHHLINRELSAEENEVIFGKCYRLHGHHYRVQVTLEAFYNPHLGLSVSRQRLAKMLSERIVGKYHGRNLNHFFPNTSCEALAYELASDLAPALKAEFPDASLRAIGVQETKKNYFEFRPAGAGL